MKGLTGFIAIFFLTFSGFSQLITDNSLTPFQLVNDVLQLVKHKGLILELNTKSLLTKGNTYPHQLFYPKIKELEIPIVVNSDCHHIENVITGFDSTYKTLLSHNFKHLHQLNELLKVHHILHQK